MPAKGCWHFYSQWNQFSHPVKVTWDHTSKGGQSGGNKLVSEEELKHSFSLLIHKWRASLKACIGTEPPCLVYFANYCIYDWILSLVRPCFLYLALLFLCLVPCIPCSVIPTLCHTENSLSIEKKNSIPKLLQVQMAWIHPQILYIYPSYYLSMFFILTCTIVGFILLHIQIFILLLIQIMYW